MINTFSWTSQTEKFLHVFTVRNRFATRHDFSLCQPTVRTVPESKPVLHLPTERLKLALSAPWQLNAALILNLGAGWTWLVNCTSRRCLSWGRTPGTHCIGHRLGPRAGLDFSENKRIVGNRTAGHRARIIVAIINTVILFARTGHRQLLAKDKTAGTEGWPSSAEIQKAIMFGSPLPSCVFLECA